MSRRKIVYLFLVVLIGIVALVIFLNRPRRAVINEDIATPSASPSSTSAVDTSSEQLLSGTWQSTQDTKYVVEFHSDGTVAERYGFEDVSVGNWALVHGADNLAVAIDGHFDSDLYLTTVIENESYYYNVLQVDAKNLALIYVPRGNILSFTRVN